MTTKELNRSVGEMTTEGNIYEYPSTLSITKMKKKEYHTVGILIKSYYTSMERDAQFMILTHMAARFHGQVQVLQRKWLVKISIKGKQSPLLVK